MWARTTDTDLLHLRHGSVDRSEPDPGEIYQIDAVGYGGTNATTVAEVESTYAVYTTSSNCEDLQPMNTNIVGRGSCHAARRVSREPELRASRPSSEDFTVRDRQQLVLFGGACLTAGTSTASRIPALIPSCTSHSAELLQLAANPPIPT
jgi:hypothetical protein